MHTRGAKHNPPPPPPPLCCKILGSEWIIPLELLQILETTYDVYVLDWAKNVILYR